MQTAGASLVAAIPAGILATLLVMMFLRHSENLPMMLQVITGGTLLFAAVVALTPFGVLLFGGKKKAAPAPADKAKGATAVSDDDEEAEVIASDELEEDGDIAQTVDFDTDSVEALDDDDTATLDDDDLFADDDDEPATKKKKKK